MDAGGEREAEGKLELEGDRAVFPHINSPVCHSGGEYLPGALLMSSASQESFAGVSRV